MSADVEVLESWHVRFDDDARSWVCEQRRKIGNGEWERNVIVCPDERSARHIATTGQLPSAFGR